ncbi:cystathionine beta-lyase [Podospora conica]|nr:cystathionine beta-lyase [Schizothecium conicum]
MAESAPDPAITQNVPDQPGPDHLARALGKQLSLASRSVHADDYINNHQAVAPPMHVSTTFRYSRNPDDLVSWENVNPNAPFDSHIYSRDSAPNTTRLEAILTSLLGAPTLTYASGLAAFHALLVYLNPRRVALAGGYHGSHGVLALLRKLTGLEVLSLTSPADLARLAPGDVIHVETPVNPTGEARDLAFYRRLADAKGCRLTVDATFAPPPLMDPFAFGADAVVHSGTKYFGGHSDMLCGTVSVRDGGWLEGLREERLVIGGVMGSLEGWLGVRSLRTLELRVVRQSASAQRLVDWLVGDEEAGEYVERVQHASQQPEAKEEGSWLRKQMPRGYGPVFALFMKDAEQAKRLPSKLHLFHHATSLGGVESLIEWRAMSDKGCDKRLLRISVGVEGWEDLRDDLLQGFRAMKA